MKGLGEKQLILNELKWTTIYFLTASVFIILLPFPADLVLALLSFLVLSWYRRYLLSKKFGMKNSPSAVSGFGFKKIKELYKSTVSNSTEYDQSKVKYYYCMNCGYEHKESSCPNCGSKMKRAELYLINADLQDLYIWQIWFWEELLGSYHLKIPRHIRIPTIEATTKPTIPKIMSQFPLPVLLFIFYNHIYLYLKFISNSY
jgi:hypothetical protein